MKARLVPVATALLLAAGWFGSSAAQQDSTVSRGIPSETLDSLMARQPSYWGAFPAAEEAAPTPLRNRPAPVWEDIINAPYRAVRFPIRIAARGVGATSSFMKEHRVVYHISHVLSGKAGPVWRRVGITVGGLSGTGANLTLAGPEHAGVEDRLRLGFQQTIRGTQRVTAGVRLPLGETRDLELAAGYRVLPNARYFGTGPQSTRDMESFYTQEDSWLGASFRRSAPGGVAADLSVHFSTAGSRAPRAASTPFIADRFLGRLPPGYGRRSDGMTAGITLRRDNTAESGRPDRGVVQSARLARFEAVGGGRASFWSYRGEWAQFLPLFLSKRVLALRGYLSWLDPAGGDPVPFQRLATNEEGNVLRGYRDYRWRDRGLVDLSAEYRWPIWALRTVEGDGADAYLLFDWGQVFGEVTAISARRMASSYGFGIRAIRTHGFTARVELARSREGSIFRLRADQVLGWGDRRLFRGVDPIVPR